MRKLLRCDVIREGTGRGIGQAGVRLDNHRDRGDSGEPLGNREDFPRTERTVDADSTDAEPLQCERSCLRRDAEKRASGGLVGHRCKNREIGQLARCENSGAHLEQIGHGFQINRVHAACRAAANLPRKNLIRLLKREGADRREQLADRTDVQCDKFCARGARVGDSGGNDFLHGVTAARGFLFVRTKGAGNHHVRACFDIASVDAGDDLRMGEIHQLGQCARRHTGLHEHGAHAAVKHEKSAVDPAVKLHSVCLSFYKDSRRTDRRCRSRVRVR